MKIGNVDQKGLDHVQKIPGQSQGQEVQVPQPKPTGRGSSESVSTAEVLRAIERANEKVMVRNTKLQFSVHERTKEIMIKVMNTDTDEIIREIPSEKILDMVANFMELAGLYIDKEV